MFVGWSKTKLGVDIERKDRSFNAREISERFFSYNECINLRKLEADSLRTSALKLWVSKEAAIKWQRGSLALDISNWDCDLRFNMAFHHKFKYN